MKYNSILTQDYLWAAEKNSFVFIYISCRTILKHYLKYKSILSTFHLKYKTNIVTKKKTNKFGGAKIYGSYSRNRFT